MKNLIFPFTAIVGQEKVKKALILNAINPGIGGVLIKGDKGTGKTTAVRALADLLPSLRTVKGCPFNCDPDDPEGACDMCRGGDVEVEYRKMRVVELPLGATEDRVVGSLDIGKALTEGIKALEPGILAEANRNILYVDEINLLDDHLVDVLLDAAAYGVNTVEREGISLQHPSRFILVGTMNPAEGELRPQLSDRIGIHINVETVTDIGQRVLIMKRRDEFEDDPEGFVERFAESQSRLRDRIMAARKLLPAVTIDDDLLELIARVCVDAGVDGHRSDIAIVRTSKAIAAFNGRRRVREEDVEDAIVLVLGERIPGRTYNRENTRREMQRAREEMERERESEEDQGDSEASSGGEGSGGSEGEESGQGSGGSQGNEGSESRGSASLAGLSAGGPDRSPETEDVDVDIKKLLKVRGRKKERLYGARVESKTSKGKYIRSRFPRGEPGDVAIDATIRAAASRGELEIRPGDIREKIRKHGARASIVLVVDISGSMFSDRKAAMVKGLIERFIEDAQRHRDRISVVGFRGRDAKVIIPSTAHASSFRDAVESIRVGGTTPMAQGIERGLEILREEKRRGEYVPFMVILSDGMPNVGVGRDPKREAVEAASRLKDEEIPSTVINFERGSRGGRDLNMEIALASGGSYYDLHDLRDPSSAVSRIMEYERAMF
ncbi:cobalt chelatase [Methanothermobacter thermautotrophicus]|uniref:Cobalt chelatase n=1 Tax=Methanothermobacter thermautotrophicus TaxID=145262 RepID=A0A842YPA4_METTF|nr:VWA domain-containing protein [Methanothermobacter thermautotrophicus]MBE2900797.1 cobalt chelatase [Methanothermobacter thermautotrophicus]MCQ8904755.1 VWA domain-containing protein [Methanothermobacter sp.]